MISTLNPLTSPIVLTDPPRVVALRREFYQLDGREEEIKRNARMHAPVDSQEELIAVRARKAEIAREIFRPEVLHELP